MVYYTLKVTKKAWLDFSRIFLVDEYRGLQLGQKWKMLHFKRLVCNNSTKWSIIH
jgi:hypothetical protein